MEGEILKSLSDTNSTNKVDLFQSKRHGRIVKKQFRNFSRFKRTIEAYKSVDRSLHPSIYKIDMKHQNIYMSYHPIEQQPESMDKTMAELLKKLHESTVKYTGVMDPGTGEQYVNWKSFMKKKSQAGVEILRPLHDYERYYETWTSLLKESSFEPVSYIHGAVRPKHIGQRKDHYLLFGFDHAIMGDPYWDIACYALEYAKSKEMFYNSYGIKDREKVDVLLHLAALDRAAFYYQQGSIQTASFNKCLSLLNES